MVDVAGLDPVAERRVGSSPTEGTKHNVSLSERLRCRIANPVRLVQFQQDTPNKAGTHKVCRQPSKLYS